VCVGCKKVAKGLCVCVCVRRAPALVASGRRGQWKTSSASRGRVGDYIREGGAWGGGGGGGHSLAVWFHCLAFFLPCVFFSCFFLSFLLHPSFRVSWLVS